MGPAPPTQLFDAQARDRPGDHQLRDPLGAFQDVAESQRAGGVRTSTHQPPATHPPPTTSQEPQTSVR